MPAEKGLFLVCRKTGKIVGFNRNRLRGRWLFPVMGLAALIWFLVRVVPKPSRASYPCQRVAAPVAIGGITYLLSVFGLVSAYNQARRLIRQNRFAVAGACLALCAACAALVIRQSSTSARATENTGVFVPVDPPNTPLGTARGIYPGRVAWSYDLTACTWDGSSDYWWSSGFNNQAKITKLMNNVICSVAGQTSVSNAWDALFRAKNGGPTAPSYVKGQSIAIKINQNNGGDSQAIDASPQSVYALLDGLVNQFGASQADITLCDPARTDESYAVSNYCRTEFPNVNFNHNQGNFTANAFNYSTNFSATTGAVENSMATTIVNAKYLITMALLKRHAEPYPTYGDSFNDGNAPVTMIFKSDWGIIGNNRSDQHVMLHTWEKPIASYDLLVDIYGSTNINGKTVLTLLDGLYSGSLWNSGPYKWTIAPFNTNWPGSIFASQDPVALESVGLDLIWAGMGLVSNADRTLREAALANNPPSGTVYQPDGVRLQSLGVHEHWNNSTNMQFSRNLGTGNGIELVTMPAGVASVSITGLASGVTLAQGTNLPVQAIVLNTNNPITQIAYYQGAKSLGVSTNMSSGVTWSNVPSGNYTLTAVATDSTGLSVTSNPVNIIVSADLTWNANPAGPVPQDGGGAWNLASSNWWNGVTNVLWNNALPPALTTFGIANAAAGAVVLGAPITVNNLAFNPAGSGNYTIAGGYALTLANTPSINVAANCSPTISASVAGTGFSMKGPGALALSGANTLSGMMAVNGGTLALSGNNTGSTAACTVSPGAALQLAGAGALPGALALNSGSTLQLRADTNATFAPASITLDNAADSNNVDVNCLTSAAGHTLSLPGTLTFLDSANQALNVTGNSSYTLALGNIVGTTTGHNPYLVLAVNTVAGGPGVTIASFQSGNWSQWLNLQGGGNVTITGVITNVSNGSSVLYVTGSTTVTLQGRSVLSATATSTADGYKYCVANGALVLDNGNALTNNTSGAGLTLSAFVLGAATNLFSGSGFSAPAGVLVNSNNSFNAAVWLGDANYPNGGITNNARNTNYVADGDAGFANSGTFSIGGQNTSGTNTYANPVILGWTANKGKSVKLLAATGGEVDFTGAILKNGTDTTAGVTVGDGPHAGIVKLVGANTYAGGTTIANGTLLVNGSLAAGAVTVQSGGSLGGAGTINGPVNILSGGALGSAASPGTLTVNSSLTLAGNVVVAINKSLSPSNSLFVVSGALTNAGAGVLTVTNLGPAFAAGDSFTLFSKPLTNGGALTIAPLVPAMGLGWVNNLAVNGTLSVVTVATNAFNLTSSLNAGNLTLSWPLDHTGWRVEAQTNPPGFGLGAGWVPVPASNLTNQFVFPIATTNGSVFLRLIYP
jgi:autotransporter-associated beta strand protein